MFSLFPSLVAPGEPRPPVHHHDLGVAVPQVPLVAAAAERPMGPDEGIQGGRIPVELDHGGILPMLYVATGRPPLPDEPANLRGRIGPHVQPPPSGTYPRSAPHDYLLYLAGGGLRFTASGLPLGRLDRQGHRSYQTAQ